MYVLNDRGKMPRKEEEKMYASIERLLFCVRNKTQRCKCERMKT